MVNNPRINFYGTKEGEAKYLSSQLVSQSVPVTAEFFPEIVSPGKLPIQSDVEIISIFVDSEVDKSVLDRFSNLKFVAIRATGFDNIDLVEVAKRGVQVSNVPAYGQNTVAEFAFALILALSRKICLASHQVKDNGNFNFDNLEGFDLRGKTIGVLGTGRIGRHAIKMALGFEMKVIATDPFPDQKFAQEVGFSYVSFDELLSQSDVITIHVPYMKETHHLINKSNIGKIKRGAYIINTSRGAVIETEALVEALKSGQLGGAGLDVLEEESVLKNESGFIATGDSSGHDLKVVLEDHVLIDMPNVIVTPHTAFNTKEAKERIMDTTISNIKAFLEGKVENVVSK